MYIFVLYLISCLLHSSCFDYAQHIAFHSSLFTLHLVAQLSHVDERELVEASLFTYISHAVVL